MNNKEKIKARILNALPQLQCKKCTYKDCESYANAIIFDNEKLNKCEPGSSHTEKQISNILNKNIKLIESNEIKDFPIAKIKVEECIGCTICIKVCPVDAIIGARHKQHFIIDDQCNGCELCITECPVDCMEMIPNAIHMYHTMIHLFLNIDMIVNVITMVVTLWIHCQEIVK